LYQAKQDTKAKDYSYIWTMNGKIYVRKNDHASSIMINFEVDLHKL